MNGELLNVLITSGVTSVISIIGFVVTYKSMKRSFREELEKEKTSVHIEKMSLVPYEILKLMEDIRTSRNPSSYLENMTSLLNTIYAYGSKDAIRIAAVMQQENYALQNEKTRDQYRAISMYILLATQVKSDVTGIKVSPELWLEMKITDYLENRNAFQKANNKIVKELELDEEFLI